MVNCQFGLLPAPQLEEAVEGMPLHLGRSGHFLTSTSPIGMETRFGLVVGGHRGCQSSCRWLACRRSKCRQFASEGSIVKPAVIAPSRVSPTSIRMPRSSSRKRARLMRLDKLNGVVPTPPMQRSSGDNTRAGHKVGRVRCDLELCKVLDHIQQGEAFELDLRHRPLVTWLGPLVPRLALEAVELQPQVRSAGHGGSLEVFESHTYDTADCSMKANSLVPLAADANKSMLMNS